MKRALTRQHPSLASFPRRPVFLALMASLAVPLCLPGSGGAMAASNTITSGTYTAIYGNDGSATPPADDTNASGNILILGNGTTGPTITATPVVGGRAPGTSNGNADSNTLIINAGTSFTSTTEILGGEVRSGSGSANGNTVTINDLTQGSDNLYIYCGRAADSGDANSNTVNITGGSASFAVIVAGWSRNGSVSYNAVNIGSGYTGTVSDSIIGGQAGLGGGNAEHNSVTINGGTARGNIFGGQSRNGAAINNTVTITTTGSTYYSIYGGYTFSTTNDAFTGNTLNLAAGNDVSNVYNMAVLNFTSGGVAGIGTLDTTPTGASGSPKVTLNTGTYAVEFDGYLYGTGDIEKTGTGTLTLSKASNNYTGDITVSAGTLSIGSDSNIGTGGAHTLAGGTLALTGASYAKNWTLDAGGGTLSVPTGPTSFDGVLDGIGALTKTGTGTLTLSGANSYTGGTTVSAGMLSIGSDNNIGTGGTHTLAGGTLALTGASYAKNWALGAGGGTLSVSTGPTSFGGILSGTGGLTKTGTGTLTLTGTNNYGGGTTVSAGTLAGDTGSLQGDILNNASVVFNQSFDDTYAGDMSGTGELIKMGAGTLTLSGANDYTGGTTVSAGTLAGDTGSLQGDVLNNASVEFYQGSAGSYSGVISGTGALIMDGGGTLTGANTYTGGTTVSAGTLVGDTDSLQGNIVNDDTVEFNQTADGTYAGVMSGWGSLAKQGAGTLTLTGTNTYSGGTTVSAGTLVSCPADT